MAPLAHPHSYRDAYDRSACTTTTFTHGCFYLQVKSDFHRMSYKTLEDLGFANLTSFRFILSPRHNELLVAPCTFHPISHSCIPSPTKPIQPLGLGLSSRKLPLTSPGTSFGLPFFNHYNHCTVRKLSVSVCVSDTSIPHSLKRTAPSLYPQCHAHSRCSIFVGYTGLKSICSFLNIKAFRI